MKKVSVIAASLVLLTGCATVVDSDVQSIRVIATCNGKSIPAQCSLENDKGLWEVNAPGSVTVHKDSSALQVRCRSPFFKGGTTQLNAGLNSLVAGNALIGGLIGVGVDALSGKGFSYQPVVKVSYADCR
jgi:hypothetical protein